MCFEREECEKADAEKLVTQLKSKRLRPRMSTETLKGKTQYVVSVGEYETEAEAASDAKSVQTVCKCTPSVIKR